MPLFAEKEENILGDILFDIVDSSNVTRSSRGSKMRALAQAVSKKMGRMYSVFDLNIGQAFLDGAEGKFLNFIGDMMAVPRLGEDNANIGSLDENIRFFVDIGTFGDINGGSPILIPAGTIISTATAGGGVRYRTLVNTILSPTDSEAFIAAEAVKTGSSSNIGANQLIFHTFTGYSDVANDTLKVTNNADIVSGQDVEIDSNYRFRIANQVLSIERANQTAIRLRALSIPSVADVVIIPFHRGIGTYDILIKSTTPSISDSLVATVQDAIDTVTSQGIVGLARGPTEIGISMTGTITFKRQLSTDEETSILTAATDNVIEYINNLDIGEEFIVNEVIERVQATSDLIRSLGRPTAPLDSLFIHRPSRLEDNKVRSSLIEDFQPKTDERVIVELESAGNTPILLRSA
jgi:uncharacterized phage protein gp47/JayE